MRTVFFRFVPGLLLGAAIVASAQAGERTYRWTDAQGRVHYSDVKADKSESVQIKPGSGVSAAPKDSPVALAARQLECQRRTDQVALYNASADINETDTLGNTRTYTAEERAKLIEKAQQQARLACTQPGVIAPDAGG